MELKGISMNDTWFVCDPETGVTTCYSGIQPVAGCGTGPWAEWDPVASPTKPRFGLQFKEGESRAVVQGRFDNVDTADKELRDQALGLAQQLERWATRPYLTPYPPYEVAEGAEPPTFLKP